jgi:Copper transport outer membrane protein, MctB
VPTFDAVDIPTVDSVDLVSGRVAMVFVLLGAEGNYGIKETADQLLPDLLVPAPERGQ